MKRTGDERKQPPYGVDRGRLFIFGLAPVTE